MIRSRLKRQGASTSFDAPQPSPGLLRRKRLLAHTRGAPRWDQCFLVLFGGDFLSFFQMLWAFWPSSKQPFLSLSHAFGDLSQPRNPFANTIFQTPSTSFCGSLQQTEAGQISICLKTIQDEHNQMKASAKQNKNETKNKVIALNIFQKIQIQKHNLALVTN